MVEKQRPRSGSRFSLNPLTAAALDAIPPTGYKPPPSLIGLKTVPTAQRLLRAKNYAQAYKTTSIKDWNSYIAFGIQQFESPAKYLAQCDAETSDERNLRIARYYRLHLENNAPVERQLMQKINTVETALKALYPGYFEMSVGEMDEYVTQLSPDPMECESQITSTDDTADICDVTLATQPSPDRTSTDTRPSTTSLHKSAAVKVVTNLSKDGKPPLKSSVAAAIASVELNQQTKAADPSSPKAPKKATGIFVSSALDKTPPSTPPRTSTKQHGKTPSSVTNVIRVEVRWAPKDFVSLKASRALMYSRFAPILSCFNTTHSWVVEWQTDQVAKSATIEPTQLSQFLSVRNVASTQQKCFYFSFRLNASGQQFVQVARSKTLQDIKRGENLSFDPSNIPQTQGEVTNVGDILLKDANTTHRTQYLKFLRDEVLPADMPLFDLKVRHKDPSGSKIQVLTVRCGKQVATQVAQQLSIFLNGEGTNPEIFISRLALGANRLARGDHAKIYQVHQDYMDDIVYLPFLSSKQIDTPLLEYLDSGEQLNRTPRQWAKSLTNSEGQSMEVDMENGRPGGEVVLILPSASLNATKEELHKYWQRQNPMMMHAERFYSASVLADPDIPLTVFTKNIDTILSKRITKKVSSPTSESVLSPASSLTGQTSKTSKQSIAWQVPLHQQKAKPQPASARNKANTTIASDSLKESDQLQRIAALESQLASMSAGNSHASGDKSQLSGNSPNSLATAHARLDGIEVTVNNIQSMLQTLTLAQSSPSEVRPSTSTWPSMPRKQLFADQHIPSETQLALLPNVHSPAAAQKASKRRKAAISPSDQNLQYNDQMDSGGDESF